MTDRLEEARYELSGRCSFGMAIEALIDAKLEARGAGRGEGNTLRHDWVYDGLGRSECSRCGSAFLGNTDERPSAPCYGPAVPAATPPPSVPPGKAPETLPDVLPIAMKTTRTGSTVPAGARYDRVMRCYRWERDVRLPDGTVETHHHNVDAGLIDWRSTNLQPPERAGGKAAGPSDEELERIADEAAERLPLNQYEGRVLARRRALYEAGKAAAIAKELQSIPGFDGDTLACVAGMLAHAIRNEYTQDDAALYLHRHLSAAYKAGKAAEEPRCQYCGGRTPCTYWRCHAQHPRAVEPQSPAPPPVTRWRVGRSLGRTLYRDEQCVGIVDTPELAAEIVAAVNSLAAPSAAAGREGEEDGIRRAVAYKILDSIRILGGSDGTMTPFPFEALHDKVTELLVRAAAAEAELRRSSEWSKGRAADDEDGARRMYDHAKAQPGTNPPEARGHIPDYDGLDEYGKAWMLAAYRFCADLFRPSAANEPTGREG